MSFKSKILIKSQNAVGTEIASELSGDIYAVTRRDFSTEMLEKSNAVLVDNTTGDMDEVTESAILSGKSRMKFFVLTGDSEPLIDNKNGVLFLSEKLGTANVSRFICYCLDTQNRRKQAEKSASEMLLYIGFQVNLKGYRYAIESVLMILENPEIAYQFNNALYPMIAEKHNVAPLSVERALRTSIESAYDRNQCKFEDIFGYKLQKPTNTEFITFCAEKIRLEIF